MTYRETILAITNKLVERFSEVYHSAEIVTIGQDKFPATTIKEEWKQLVPSDQKEVIYLRRNGDDVVEAKLDLGSCVKAYKMGTGVRVVFFRDYAQNHNKIIADLLQSVLILGVKLNRVIMDKWKLQKDESNGDFNFGPSTAYFAIDVTVYWDLKADSCDEDFCIDDDNPIKCNVS